MYEAGLYANGAFLPGKGASCEVLNPATEEVLAELRCASADQVRVAIRAARQAQRAWAAEGAVARGALVRRIADVLASRREQLADLLVREVGKPRREALGEVDYAVANARYIAEWDRRIEGEIVASDDPREEIHLRRVPVGVVGAIAPWNYPIGLFVRKVAPALLTGNAVVFKPSPETPLATLALAHAIDSEVGLPAGVLNLVTGGREVGEALVADPDVDMISMTGHRDSGKAIMAAAAANLTRVSLELGGKAPAVVLADADLELAVAELVASRHANAGQVCTCAERVYVERGAFDEFVERYVESVGALRVGHPFEDPDLGPLVSAGQRDRVVAAVRGAESEGATVLTGGGTPDGREFGRGYWIEPTVFVDVTPEMAIMREETFGPVTPIMAVDSLEQAVKLAADSRYGLSAYVFSDSYTSVLGAINRIDHGEIYVNRRMGESFQGHHTGLRESGVGGEDGKHGVLRYTQLQTVYHRFGR